jgi:hypothetical protein
MVPRTDRSTDQNVRTTIDHSMFLVYMERYDITSFYHHSPTPTLARRVSTQTLMQIAAYYCTCSYDKFTCNTLNRNGKIEVVHCEPRYLSNKRMARTHTTFIHPHMSKLWKYWHAFTQNFHMQRRAHDLELDHGTTSSDHAHTPQIHTTGLHDMPVFPFLAASKTRSFCVDRCASCHIRTPSSKKTIPYRPHWFLEARQTEGISQVARTIGCGKIPGHSRMRTILHITWSNVSLFPKRTTIYTHSKQEKNATLHTLKSDIKP